MTLSAPLQHASRSWSRLRQSLRALTRFDGRPTRTTSASEDVGTWASLLSLQPTVIGSWPTDGLPLGIASVVGPLLCHRPVDFLIFPTWAWELPEVARPIISAATDYVAKHPLHRLAFLCNTASQEPPFAEAGWPAAVLNSNIFCNDAQFRPLAEVAPRYDAIYNARLAPMKRHELAAEIENLCLVYFYALCDGSVAAFHAEHARLRAAMPKATFLNRLTPEGCDHYPASTVNIAMNQARVGLCLSAVEGQMRASMEYMMAGLPIVSTPSIGGRDYFFDDEYCATVHADPRSIREAVAAMAARCIPRDHIRARTLARVERERSRFVDFVQNIIERRGGRTDFAAAFPDLLRGNRLKIWYSSANSCAKGLSQASNERE